jgi:DNA-directed RNA polymerase specialized sigma24 family protein
VSEDPNSFGELVERATRGDQAAWQVLWDEYLPGLQVILRRRWRRACQALNGNPSDLLETAWEELLPSFSEMHFESPAHFVGYFLKCAENLLRKKLRGRERLPPRPLPDPDEEPAVGEKWSVLETLAQQESVDRVQSRLTTDQLRLLELRAAGYGWTDIAQAVWGRRPIKSAGASDAS